MAELYHDRSKPRMSEAEAGEASIKFIEAVSGAAKLFGISDVSIAFAVNHIDGEGRESVRSESNSSGDPLRSIGLSLYALLESIKVVKE